MPTPMPNEEKPAWMSRCIPVLMNEGKPQDQAVAICNSIWEQNMDKSKLFEVIRKRSSRSGIVTADRYFRDVEGCFDGGSCPTVAEGYSEDQWRKALKEAETKLTYTNAETEVLKNSISSSPDGIMEFEAIITTPLRDRDRDILNTIKANIDPRSSLLMYHMPMETVGAFRGKTRHDEHQMKGKFVIADTAMGHDSSKLIKVGALRISHGFDPKKWREMEDGEGYFFEEFDIYEVSLVSIPSNIQAVITEFSGKDFETPFVRQLQKHYWKTSGKEFSAGGFDAEDLKKTPACECHKNKTPKTKEFDVERQHIEASKLEYDWVSRYCSCEVKQLVNYGTFASRIYMGSFLTGLKHALSETVEVDCRRLTSGGLESPPEYETIQLNSTKSDHFLINGISFRKTGDGTCFALKYVRDWRGEEVEFFCAKKDEDKVGHYISEAWKWVSENNFLKGEAFSLDGEFLPKTHEDWGDLFLDPVNEKEIRKSVEVLNTKGKSSPNRGQVYLGPPGTGKTLSARIMRNHCDATFIWIGGKQAYYYGGINAVCQAFELAKDLAPAIVLMEDIDASLDSRYAVDVLKTEMDGMGRSAGILTVLTTNHPESFPEALLDRPGRFHDVLKFDLPSDETRIKMLRKWLPDLDEKTRIKTIEDTEGYSGAHVYELCQYAKSLQESEEIGIDDALVKAIKKIHDQRALIDQELCRDRTIASRRRSEPVEFVKSKQITKSIGFTEKKFEKAGSRLSSYTMSELQEVIADVQAIRDTEGVSRPIMALADSALRCLNELVGETEEDEGKSFSHIERKYFAALAKAGLGVLKRQCQRVELMLSASEDQEKAREMEAILSIFN